VARHQAGDIFGQLRQFGLPAPPRRIPPLAPHLRIRDGGFMPFTALVQFAPFPLNQEIVSSASRFSSFSRSRSRDKTGNAFRKRIDSGMGAVFSLIASIASRCALTAEGRRTAIASSFAP